MNLVVVPRNGPSTPMQLPALISVLAVLSTVTACSDRLTRTRGLQVTEVDSCGGEHCDDLRVGSRPAEVETLRPTRNGMRDSLHVEHLRVFKLETGTEAR